MVTDQFLVIFICFSAISKGKLSLHDHHPLCILHPYCLYLYLSFSLLSVVSFHISLQILYILLLFFFHALFSACLYVLSFFKPVLLHYILYVSIIAPFLRLVISLCYVLNSYISLPPGYVLSLTIFLMLSISRYCFIYYSQLFYVVSLFHYFYIYILLICNRLSVLLF